LPDPDPDPKRGTTTLEVNGPVTRAEVDRWRDAFVGGLAAGDGLRLDLSGSGPWDLAGVQLLLAAIVSGERAHRPIALARIPKVLTALAERAGVMDRLAAFAEDHAP
jgi:ABC-type transporter Mla MlaB component